MSIKRRELFVGLLDNKIWTKEKLMAYLNKYASTNDDEYIVDCQIMSYRERDFQGKSFAFVTFSNQSCVDRCMNQRDEFNKEYGITMKRLLPDTITKCQRLMSSPDIVIRISEPDSLFTEENIRSYFSRYGNIQDLKMLEEEKCAGMCLITFEDFDSSDRVLLDIPHYLNEQILSVDKYTAPEYICSLSQYRFIDENSARQIKRWFPIFRNLIDFMKPLNSLYRTQLALMRYSFNKQILISKENVNKTKENLVESENKYNNVKQEFIQLSDLNKQLKKQIEDIQNKNDKKKYEYEYEIQQQRIKNQSLKDMIARLKNNS